ncbi:MAG: hypothetical protein IH604_00620 [Burkholderiales bacterium]|nr:hypothetical protein [Burkholderiales bacterium]
MNWAILAADELRALKTASGGIDCTPIVILAGCCAVAATSMRKLNTIASIALNPFITGPRILMVKTKLPVVMIGARGNSSDHSAILPLFLS